jgi:hypothetical protein
VMFGSTAGVGGFVADRQWFGATLARMDYFLLLQLFSSFLL